MIEEIKEDRFLSPAYFKVAYFLVPVVGILISLIFLIVEPVSDVKVVVSHLIYGIVVTTGLWVGCMVIVRYLWEKYPWQFKPLKHLVIEIFAILIYTLAFSGGLFWLSYALDFATCRSDAFLGALFTVFITFLITAIHEAVFFYMQWKYNFSKSVQLENQNLKAKYESLKSQINPHYLFNGLNNLISIVDDNPLAVEYIQQMSSFLRYMLKSRDKDLVSLDEELEMLKKYLYLHQIRFGDILNVDIEYDVENKSLCMPPLTLQMLVENCIKHNVIAKNKHLNINITINNDGVWVINNKNPKHNVVGTGKGLENIKERYKYYTNEDIEIIENDNYFKVWVPLVMSDGG